MQIRLITKEVAVMPYQERDKLENRNIMHMPIQLAAWRHAVFKF